MPALQEDYAFLAQGFLALYDETGQPQWLERARELTDTMLGRFWDPVGGGLYMAEPSAATRGAPGPSFWTSCARLVISRAGGCQPTRREGLPVTE